MIIKKRFLRSISASLITLLLFGLLPSNLAFAFSYDEGFYDSTFETNYNRAEYQTNSSADTWDGSFSTKIPIVVPAGRDGMQPDLTLNYSSSTSNMDNIYGYGWSLGIPSISRLKKKGVDTLYTEEYFTSSFDGEMVDIALSSGSYGEYAARVEGGGFLTYEYNSSGYWTATDKSGTVYTFGSSADTRQDNPSDSTQVYKWMLEEVRDANDNYVKYEYTKDNGQVYPDTITYTGHGSTDGIFSVEFTTEARTDTFSSYATGFEIQTNYRISGITTYVDGTWAKEYDLAYTTGDNGVRSMLESVTESARNSDGTTTTLPATEMTYETATPSWSLDSGYSFPLVEDEPTASPSFSPFYYLFENANSGEYHKGSEIADVNGDGLLDLLYSGGHGGVTTPNYVYLNDGDGTGWTVDWTYEVPVYFWNKGGMMMRDSVTADINGDSFPDFIYATSGYTNETYINNGDGTGWTDYSSDYNFPVSFNAGYPYPNGVRVFDVNGDNLPDVVQSDSSNQAVYINNGDGTGWTRESSYNIPVHLDHGLDTTYRGVDIADVNGDGLLDIINSIQSGSFTQKVYINQGDGTGWVEDTNYSIPVPFFISGGNALKNVRLSDVNGDGLIDLINAYRSGSTDIQEVYINNGDGTGWTQDTSYSIPILFNTAYAAEEGIRVFDANGDGLPDLLKSYLRAGSPSTSLDQAVYINDGEKADVLTGITHSKGATTSVSYSPSTSFDNPNLPFVMQVVDTVTIDDGLGNTSTISYDYEGGEFYYESEYEKQFAGFETVTKTEDGRVTETSYHQGDDDRSKIGRAYKTAVYDEYGNLYQLSYNTWTNYDLGYDNDFVYKEQSVTMTYDGGSTSTDSAVTYEYDTATGNVTSQTEYGEVTASSSDGSFTDISSSDNRTTDYTYAVDSSGVIQGKVATQTVSDSSSTTLAETKYYYDELAHGSVSTGNMTSEAHWLDTDGSWASVDYSVNSYGLVDEITNARGYSQTIAYDSYDLYPDTVTNALGHETSYQYDYASGRVTRETNANGFSTEYTYDGFGRVLTSSVPDPSTGAVTQISETVYYDSSVPTYSITTTTVDGVAMESRVYYDGLGRTVEEWKPGESDSAVVDYSYDQLGNLESQSLPYTSSPEGYTYFAYDPMGRVTTQTSPLGTTSYSYSGLNSTVTDANGGTKVYTYDSYGQLEVVDEYNDGSVYTTNYEYDLLGQLTNINDAQGNERGFTYDSLGRKTSQENLHDTSVSALGLWSYQYDANGNMLEQLDPNGQVISWAYDELDRATAEDWDDDGSADITYAYDSATNGVGMLASVTSSASYAAYAYDAQGNVAQESETIDGTTYVTQTSYDLLGRTDSVLYPDSAVTASYEYNSAGQIESVSKDGTLVVNDIDYAAHGKVEYAEFANGTATTNTYDASENLMLTGKATTGTFDDDPSDSFMEVGMVEDVDENWVTVTLANEYENPVIVAVAGRENNNSQWHSMSTRIQNVTGNSFEVRLQSALLTDPDKDVYTEDVYFTVVEEGEWEMTDSGTKVEAGLVESSTVSGYLSSYTGNTVDFQSDFEDTPVILHQVMSYNDSNWISSFVSGFGSRYMVPDENRMQISLLGAAVTATHGQETIAWIAVESGVTGEASGTQFESQLISGVQGYATPSTVNFAMGTLNNPRAVVSQIEMDGGDGSWAIIDNINSFGLTVFVEEDVADDVEKYHLPETLGYFATSGDALIGLTNPDSGPPRMEVGSVTTETSVDITIEVASVESVTDAWTSVTFENTNFTDPVIVTSVTPINNTTPLSVRLRNITSSGFDIALQAANGSSLATETVSYMAVERGTWMLDGHLIEANYTSTSTTGSSSDIGGSWLSDVQSYQHSYTTAPIVLHQVQTTNDTDWITTWISQIGKQWLYPNLTGFQIGLNGAEVTTSHGEERIGWIIIEHNIDGTTQSASGSVDFETSRHNDTVLGYDNGCYSFSYNSINSPDAITFASMQDLGGYNGGWAAFSSQDSTSACAYVEEDQVRDTERAHLAETLGAITFSGEFYSEVNSSWTTVNLAETYESPVIIVTVSNENREDPLSARIDNVTGTSFDVALQVPAHSTGDPEDAYFLGNKLYYMVIEEGAWQMGNTKIEAYKDEISTVSSSATIGGTWTGEEQTYTHSYDASPIVLHQVMSYNDSDWITSNVSGPGAYTSGEPTSVGFQISMNGTRVTTTHDPETIGWVVIENDGSDTYSIDGVGSVAFVSEIPSSGAEGWDDSPGCFTFTHGETFDGTGGGDGNPIVLGSQMGIDGGNGSWLRSCSVTATEVGFYAEEDMVYDPTERNHSEEELGYIVFDRSFSSGGPSDADTSVTGNVQDLTYSYDSVGNITGIIDASVTPTAKTLAYTYDDLNRLLSADSSGLAAGDYSLTYQYDEVGNMTYKSDVGTMLYEGTGTAGTGSGGTGGSPIPHAVTSVDGLSRSYDNNGNLLDDGESTYNWNIRNKLDSSGDMSYTYDHSGSRVKSVNAATGEETVYINQYMELRDGEPVYYIFAGGTRVASLQDDNSGTGTLEITYLHQDHLGGTALATDSDGLVVQLYDYYPFGTQLEDASYGDSEVEVNHSFTDKEFEEELGLYYFEARWYDSEIGKFGSMDPAVLDERVFEMLQDPQSFNAYAYSRNNPVVLVDPDGELFDLVTGLQAWGQMAANAYYQSTGNYYTASFLHHSFQANPSDLYYGNDSNLASTIRGSSEYQTTLGDIQNEISDGATGGEFSFRFESGDLHTSIGKISGTWEVTGFTEENGYSVNITMNDKYNFDMETDSYSDNGALTTINNIAEIATWTNVMNEYNISVEVNENVSLDD